MPEIIGVPKTLTEDREAGCTFTAPSIKIFLLSPMLNLFSVTIVIPF